MKAKEHKRPFLLLYINEFIGSPVVQAMNDSQVRWYLWLLMRAWQNDPACCLPNDDAQLMMYAGCKSKKQWDAQKGLVLSAWEADESGKFVSNARLLAEYRRMCVINEKRKEAGKKSAANKQQNSTSVEQTTATETLTETETKPLSNTPPSDKPKADPRFSVLVEDIQKYWVFANKSAVPFKLSAADGKNLKRFLSDNAKVDRDLWQKCLRNRARSPAVVQSQAINKWILNLLEFAHGTLDRFNKPESVGGKGEGIRKTNAQSEAEYLATLGVTDADSEFLQAGSEFGRPGDVDGTAEVLPPRGSEGGIAKAHGNSE